MKRKVKKEKRSLGLIAVLVVISIIFSIRTLDFQLISASQYASSGFGYKKITTPIKASRGEIFDRYGRAIATVREGYNVVLNNAYLTKAKLNSTILELTSILKQFDIAWNDNLPITTEYPYSFTDNTSAVDALRNKLSLNYYATVDNCVDAMLKKYSLQDYSEEEQRILMGVRYTMDKADYSISNPFTFAEDISSEVMVKLSEKYSEKSGVEINIVTYRDYTDETIAPHLIGTIGKIDAGEWDELSKKGYSYNDYIGKSGVEKVFEEYLKGVDGTMTYTLDTKGNILSSDISREPIQGNSVYLTIDANLQLVAQKALSDNIWRLNAQGSHITGGAVVVMEVNSGDVLASANYPSYSLDDYYNNYKSLSTDNIGKPLFDRALNGKYAPGSVFKPLVAIAGLDLGIIDKYSSLKCVQKYQFYDDYQPSCMHYHGNINLTGAISKSCNYYFFDLGRRCNIDNLNKYAKLFGLGVSTGIELTSTSGVLAGPEYSKSINKQWFAGNTLAAAIGQSDNAFSPLQMAVYTSTIANGGTRYKATVLNKVVGSNGVLVFDNQPQVLSETGINEAVIDVVKQGMRAVTAEGTASNYFANYSIAVGGKTGTAQTTGLDHNAFTVFAPYENPEIAITVYVEHGEYSTSTGPVAKAIMDTYFFGEAETYVEPPVNQLLK